MTFISISHRKWLDASWFSKFNHSHLLFLLSFSNIIFSLLELSNVQRDISIGFSDMLVIVTVQIAKARSILHQHCLPNTIYFLLMKCTNFFAIYNISKLKFLPSGKLWSNLIDLMSLTVWRYESWDNRKMIFKNETLCGNYPTMAIWCKKEWEEGANWSWPTKSISSFIGKSERHGTGFCHNPIQFRPEEKKHPGPGFFWLVQPRSESC